MNYILSGLVLLLGLSSLEAASKCPAAFKPPEQCFFADELKEYSSTATGIESLYNKYVNLLTDAKLTIDGDEPGVNLFFGGELQQKVRKLKFHGNSIITFLEIVLHHVCREQGLDAEQLLHCFRQLNVTADYFEICEQYEAVDCNERSLVYQPVDGVCVNNDFPYRGSKNTPFRRLIKNSFDDSIHEVRSSAHDQTLPSARLISTGLRTLYLPISFESNENLHNDFILMFATEVVMDIAKSLKSQTWSGNYGFECCDCNGRTKISQRFSNRHCMPIEISDKDPVFRGRKCMNYIRAMVTHNNCELKEASVLNTVTSFLDMDFIYVPSNIKKAIKNGGKFVDKEHHIHRSIILGDERSAMLPQVYALAVVWIKFHNLVVDEFSKLYPYLSSDVKFYEARRLVIAIYQHIFYSEVLPLLVSAKAIARYRLASKKNCYDPNVDPSVTAEFTSSAARYFHTFIQNSYIVNYKNGTKADVLLRNLNDEILGYTEITGVISGLLDRSWNTLDIASEPSNYLFTSNGGPGLDLRAIDLQTERDFGIGTYCDALYYFNLTKGECIKRFSDFEPFITDSNIEFLKYAYDVPCDVDFGVGAGMHSSDDGDILSEIFDRIFAMQFKNIKCGDPYFYSNVLDKDQLNFIDYFTFKDILCYTLPDLPHVQPFVFLTPGVNNTKEACNGSLNLENWKLHVDPTKHDSTELPIIPSEDSTVFEVPSEIATIPPNSQKPSSDQKR